MYCGDRAEVKSEKLTFCSFNIWNKEFNILLSKDEKPNRNFSWSFLLIDLRIWVMRWGKLTKYLQKVWCWFLRISTGVGMKEGSDVVVVAAAVAVARAGWARRARLSPGAETELGHVGWHAVVTSQLRRMTHLQTHK